MQLLRPVATSRVLEADSRPLMLSAVRDQVARCRWLGRRKHSAGSNPRRGPGRLVPVTGAFLALNFLGVYVHDNDDYFFRFYPFPFAIDAARGGSMLPTMAERALHYRDCWSHRVAWFNVDHLRKCFSSWWASSASSDAASLGVTASFRRPWQKGDIVTLYNPHTKHIVTKRIVGTEGDSVQTCGEYGHEYRVRHRAVAHGTCGDEEIAPFAAFGVPYDARFPIPFCQQERTAGEASSPEAARMVVPPKHVWIEGDNPLQSTDSRHYGPLPESCLRGRVVRRLWPLTNSPLAGEREGGNDCNDGGRTSVLSPTRPAPFMNAPQSKQDLRWKNSKVTGGGRTAG